MQTTHRVDIEKRFMWASIRSQTRGQYLGALIALAVLGLAGYCAYLGMEILAGILAAIDVSGLAGVFVYGRHRQDEERQRKR